MADKFVKKNLRAQRRRQRVRGKVQGTADRPRMAVTKTLNNMFVQLIDDEQGVTLAAVATNSKNVRDQLTDDMKKVDIARKVGEIIAREAKEKGIETVVFDRNRSPYHGRVKAVAEGARKAGLKM